MAKQPVDQKHAGKNGGKIEVGLDMGPQTFGRDPHEIPIFETEIPEFKEEPEYGGPEEKDDEFSRSLVY